MTVVGAKVRVESDFSKVKRAAEKGNFQSLGRAGAYIRGVAQKSIKISRDYAQPGHPPHSRRGKLKEAIFFATERNPPNTVIGPVVSRLGTLGKIHEKGGRYKIRKTTKRGPMYGNYPKRPFMAPALEISRPRLPSMWAGSVSK